MPQPFKKQMCHGTKSTNRKFGKSSENLLAMLSQQHPAAHKISTQSHQCGGTLQVIVGSWVSHAVQSGMDSSGLGQWSYIKLQGRDNKWYIILSGCNVCNNQGIDMGSNNTYNQQYQLLVHQQGYQNPGSCSKFLDNLMSQIKTWQAQQKAVLICIIASNNPQHTSTKEVSDTFSKTDLLDLHML